MWNVISRHFRVQKRKRLLPSFVQTTSGQFYFIGRRNHIRESRHLAPVMKALQIDVIQAETLAKAYFSPEMRRTIFVLHVPFSKEELWELGVKVLIAPAWLEHELHQALAN